MSQSFNLGPEQSAAERLINPNEIAAAALGHKKVSSPRCTAIEKESERRIPGPKNPPRFCGLKVNHEGPHFHIYGTKKIRMRKELVEHRQPIEVCEKCRVKWPCHDAEKLIEAFSEIDLNAPLNPDDE